MSSAHVEETILEEDQSSLEFRILKAYAQHRLSGLRLESGASAQGEGRAKVPAVAPLASEEGLAGQKVSAPSKLFLQKRREKEKKKRERTGWKCLFVPSCLRPQAQAQTLPKEAVNGNSPKLHPRGGVFTKRQDDSEISLWAKRFAEVVDQSRRSSERRRCHVVERTLSLEEDGSWASKAMPEAYEAAMGKEDKVIDAIVAFLRKSGDELEEKMQKDKTFSQSVLDMMSYAFFRRVTHQVLEEAPTEPAGTSQEQGRSLQVAWVMEVTARLAGVDNHPMSRMLGFGSKFLQEDFSPWVQNQGGWEKVSGFPEGEELE